jgi:hypothetical protein
MVAAALRIAEGQRKARAKFSRADAMWMTPTGAEQATGEVVARHKAARFAASGSVAVVDLCCGIGGDAIALAGAGLVVLAVDLDAAMGRRLAWNAGVHGVAGRVVPVRARAERIPIPDGVLVHVDPDRRAGRDRRAGKLAGYVPDAGHLRRLIRDTQGGAIKLGPASDFDRLADAGAVEVELISLDGECKEATLWHGELAGGVRRRATALPSGASWAGDPGATPVAPVAERAGRWIFDPDPALVRSGLLDDFAVRHGLARLDAGVAYLTAGDLVETPFLRAVEVEAILAVDRKQLRRHVRARGLRPVEVKVRGLDLDPATVRGWFDAPPGARPVSLVLSGGAAARRAIVARRHK